LEGETFAHNLFRRELDHPALCEAGPKLEDVPDRGATKPIETLVLVANDAEIAGLLSELEQNLFLDVVCVLVFVHEDVVLLCPPVDTNVVLTERSWLNVGSSTVERASPNRAFGHTAAERGLAGTLSVFQWTSLSTLL
jgi:hypothetical protein